ncbi:MAG: 16S rRNA (guanine(527)-N(7))-methyltransferase RsmG [Ginsengibacter sp.]
MLVLQKYFPGLDAKQIEQLTALYPLYAEWNQKINVISRKDMENFYVHHVLHSLSIATQFDFPDGYEIMDFGTGGGFPGIPLAIFFPEVHFLLVDSITKKLKVAEEIVSATGLTNVTTQHSRAEEIGNKKFDIVLSRAVASLKDLWFWSRPLLKKKPVTQPKKLTGLICLKGGDLSQEISESGTRPRIWEIEKIFDEPFFKQKYILHVSSSQ